MKKKYTSPVVQVYHVNPTEVICTSPTRSLLWATSDEVADADEDGVIQAESASYRTTLWN